MWKYFCFPKEQKFWFYFSWNRCLKIFRNNNIISYSFMALECSTCFGKGNTYFVYKICCTGHEQGIDGVGSVLLCILESSDMFTILSYPGNFLQSVFYLHTNPRIRCFILHGQENHTEKLQRGHWAACMLENKAQSHIYAERPHTRSQNISGVPRSRNISMKNMAQLAKSCPLKGYLSHWSSKALL